MRSFAPALALWVLLGTAATADAQQNPFDPRAFPRSAPLPGPVRLEPIPRSAAAATPAPLLNTAFKPAAGSLFGAPPDPSGACGPRGLFSISNYRVIYGLKGSGGVYYDMARDQFFGAAHPNDSYVDPRVIYDPQSGHFFATMLEVPLGGCGTPSNTFRSYLRIAVSTSDHPRQPTDWLVYSFDVTRVVTEGGIERHYAPDYPALAVDANCVTLAADYFEMPLPCGPQRGIGVISLSKAELLAGTATPHLVYSEGHGEFALSPVSQLWGGPSGAVTYLVELPLGITNAIRLWALSDPLGAGTLSFTSIVIPDHGFGHPNMGAPQCPPASGPTKNLRTWAGTAQGIAQSVDGSIWFCGTGTALDGGGGLDRTRVHWYRLDPNGYPASTPALQETGVVDAGPGTWNFSPSITVAPTGDVGLVFTQSSATLCPRAMATMRPAGAVDFAAPLTVDSSPEFYADWDAGLDLIRWGDYAAASVDPIDHSIWVTHMVGDTGQVWPKAPGLSYAALDWVIFGNLILEDLASGWPAGGRMLRRGQSGVQGMSVAPDSAGGLFALWTDRSRNALEHRMLRIGAGGEIPTGWTTNGSSVGASTNAVPGTVLADGVGGAYTIRRAPPAVLMADRRSASGAQDAGWPAAQVTVASSVTQYRAASDGHAGVLVAWSASGGIRVQKVTGAGSLAWTPVLVASVVTQPEICADGAGGAFVGWVGASHVFVKRVLSAGVVDPAWPANGVDLGVASGPRLVADAAGGAYVVYAAAGDLHAVRLTAAGTAAPGWAGGVDVVVAPGGQSEQVAVSDGAGGLLVAWTDARDAATSGSDVYVTRLAATGTRAAGWTAQGTRVCGAPGPQRRATLVDDGAGGAVVAWVDGRGNPDCLAPGCGDDIYWSRVRADGGVDASVAADGNVVSAAVGDQSDPALVRGAPGSALVTWLDGSLVPDGDPDWVTQVMAQRLETDLVAPAATHDLSAMLNGCTTVQVDWTATGDDGISGTATAYDLRYSSSPITAQNFAAATALATNPPGHAGGVETYLFDLGECSGPLYFGLRTRDEAGNASALSNLPGPVQTACAPPPCVTAVDGGPTLVDGLNRTGANPAEGLARFRAGIAVDHPGARFEVAVFDISGRTVRVLRSGPASAGSYAIEWDLHARDGARVRSGLYFVRLSSPAGVFTRGIVVR